MMFAHARNALLRGLQLMEAKQGDVALLPEFVCEALAQPFRAMNFSLSYYETDESLRPDWDDLNRLAGPRTRALVMVNYFGNHQDIGRFEDFAMSKRLLLIEDSAHGAFGEISGEPVGTLGDIGIVSERKIAGTETGASLFVHGVPIAAPVSWPLSTRRSRPALKRVIVERRETPFVGDTISKCLRMYSEVRGRGRLIEPVQAPVLAHPDDVARIMSQDRPAVIRRRRDLWQQVNERVRHVPGLVPVFDKLSEGANPWAFPFRMSSHPSGMNTLALQYKLQLPVRTWPIFPQEVRQIGSTRGRVSPLLMIPLDSAVGLQN